MNKMTGNMQLTEVIQGAADAFGASGRPCREGLKQVFKELTFVLAEADALEADVMDAVWSATQRLQETLSNSDELDLSELTEIYNQLTRATDLSPPEPEPAPAEAYVIPEDDFELVEDFITEAKEHLEAAEGAMLTLEENLHDAETLNLIFRSFHTIKGMAGFMNLEQIGLLTHDAENLLDKARKGELLLSGQNAEAVFHSIDMLNIMVAALRSAIDTGGRLPPVSGVSTLISFLQECAAGAPGNPSPVKPVANEIEETDLTTPTVAPTAPKAAGTAEEKIKVSTERLDNLVNMVGELVIAQLMLAESVRGLALTDPELLRNSSHQGKIIRELQELSMSMRMVPINGVFQKMARMTRDLSKKAGKEIELVMEGENTELDRTIIDKLADPLIHMIRNSVDHGIEDPQTRTAAGKRTAGQIRLRAYHAAGNIVIEIQDDGKGLDQTKLLEKAIRRGLVSSEKNLTDSEIYNFIFLPGLSTAAEVTSISGRGVGMDVVKRNIEELRGRIDIASTPGEGTTFTITLPLTLAIIDGQVIRVGSEKYIIPINAIQRSFRPQAIQVSTIQDRREMVLVRDELLPLVRLHELFDIEPDHRHPFEGLVVVVEEDNEACCLLVDDLLDQQQVVIKNLGLIMNSTEGVSGGAILGDGMVRLILDIPGIIKLFRQ